jgi:Swt1-like HEPN
MVGKGFELLAEGLEPFVDRHMSQVAPGGIDWLELLSKRKQNRGMAQSKTDPIVLLRAIATREDVFEGVLSRVERSYAQELWEYRNKWAHNSVFNEADTHRLLDSSQRLLRAAGAASEADQAQRLLRDYRQRAARRPARDMPCPGIPVRSRQARPSRSPEWIRTARLTP